MESSHNSLGTTGVPHTSGSGILLHKGHASHIAGQFRVTDTPTTPSARQSIGPRKLHGAGSAVPLHVAPVLSTGVGNSVGSAVGVGVGFVVGNGDGSAVGFAVTSSPHELHRPGHAALTSKGNAEPQYCRKSGEQTLGSAVPLQARAGVLVTVIVTVFVDVVLEVTQVLQRRGHAVATESAKPSTPWLPLHASGAKKAQSRGSILPSQDGVVVVVVALSVLRVTEVTVVVLVVAELVEVPVIVDVAVVFVLVPVVSVPVVSVPVVSVPVVSVLVVDKVVIVCEVPVVVMQVPQAAGHSRWRAAPIIGL